MPGLPVYHQVGSTVQNVNAPTQVGGTIGAATSGVASHWKFIAWVVILGVIIPGFILGGLDYFGYRFVFKHR